MHYDPRQKLDGYKESLLALECSEAIFLDYAASGLISGIRTGDTSWEIFYWLVRSALARKDKESVRIKINDWTYGSAHLRQLMQVSKFVPGEHYHCLDAKFDTLDEAIGHLKRNGFAYGGLIERHVYAKEGD